MKKIIIIIVVIVAIAIGAFLVVSNNNKSTTSENAIVDLVDITESKVGNVDSKYQDAITINLNETSASIDGKELAEYDYTWHTDLTTVHDDVKNAPAEYYTGTLPEELESVYVDHELYYYPQLDSSKFQLVNYDGEQEWAYYYEDGENNQYIYSTLPHLGNDIPTYMMHTEEEAAQNKVLHITKAGTYVLTGSWNGQVKIDLGEDVSKDESQKVTLILNGVNINCTVAPGVIFESLYECDNTWEDSDTHTYVTDLSNAGANVIIADGSQNIVTGNNIFRMLKTKYKDDADTSTIKVQKKVRKYDGAFYSCVSMNISGGEEGTGLLQISSSFEGLDSELHLAFNSGNVIIHSKDDGSNVNEDDVSTFIMNGGTLEINAAEGQEGDGVDSNGFAIINGGTLIVNNVRTPDNAVDTEDGVYYNGGKIIIDGTESTYTVGQMYREINSSSQGMGNGRFGGGMQNGGKMPNGERPQMPSGDMPRMSGDFNPGMRTGSGDVFGGRNGNFDPNMKPGSGDNFGGRGKFDSSMMPGSGDKFGGRGDFAPNKNQRG